jgi:hypothetical protein
MVSAIYTVGGGMGCGSARSHNFVPSMLPTWNQNSFFCFHAGKFWSAAPIREDSNDDGNGNNEDNERDQQSHIRKRKERLEALSEIRRVEKKKKNNIATTEGKRNDKIKKKDSAAPDPFLQHQGGNFRRLENNNKNRRTYRCNHYCALNSRKQEWTNYKQAKAAAKKGAVHRCTGLMFVPTYEGVKSIPWFQGNHECGWKAPQLLQGKPDGRPTLELVQPSQCLGGLVSNEERESIVKVLEHANIWGKLTGGGIKKREYAKNLAGNADSLLAVRKAMEPYVRHVQNKYRALVHVKYGALRTFANQKSQYLQHNYRLHSDYTMDCKDLEPSLRPISIIVSLNAFRFLYLPTKFDKRGDIIRTTIYRGQMIMFTDDCLHSGGPNKTNKTMYRLFAYLTSRLSDIPANGLSMYTFSEAENPNDAVITEVFNKAEADKLKRQSEAKAYITRRS